MRILPAGIALLVTLILTPDLASAQQCTCTCVRGRSVPACPSTSLVQPLCQQICTDKVEQSLTGSSAAGGGSSGAASAAGISAAAAAAGIGR